MKRVCLLNATLTKSTIITTINPIVFLMNADAT